MNLKNTILLKNLVKCFLAFNAIFLKLLFYGLLSAL
jgi:hypothetical protein